MKGWTTIRIRKKMRDRLAKLKLHARESYDEVINREISNYLAAQPAPVGVRPVSEHQNRPSSTAGLSGKRVGKEINAARE